MLAKEHNPHYIRFEPEFYNALGHETVEGMMSEVIEAVTEVADLARPEFEVEVSVPKLDRRSMHQTEVAEGYEQMLEGRPASSGRRSSRADLRWVPRELGLRWRWADCRADDMAIHTPHPVLDASTPVARMSVVIRFLRYGARVDRHWTRPLSADDGA